MTVENKTLRATARAREKFLEMTTREGRTVKRKNGGTEYGGDNGEPEGGLMAELFKASWLVNNVAPFSI